MKLNTVRQHRIAKSFLFIEEHLHEPLNLHQIAAASFYAPYHFHRVFKEVTGESVSAYVSRRRLERCASLLLNEIDTPITEIALSFGFSNTSAFSRAFKKRFGVAPSEFRKNAPSKYSKICITESKNGEVVTTFEPYFRSITNMLKYIEMNTTIEVKEISEMHVAYVAHVGLMTQDIGYHKIMQWARPRGHMDRSNLVMTSMYLDSAKTTSPDKVRVNIGVILDAPIEETAGVHYMKFKPGKCAVGSFKLNMHEFEKAWVSMFVWVNEQGYKVGDMPPFELYYNDYRTHPEGKCIVDICVPIQ